MLTFDPQTRGREGEGGREVGRERETKGVSHHRPARCYVCASVVETEEVVGSPRAALQLVVIWELS